jgi:hypothetical protein
MSPTAMTNICAMVAKMSGTVLDNSRLRPA